jgi:hypothetical protein
VRIHTSIVAAIVTLAFAGPAVAGTQTGPYIGTMPAAGSASATQTHTQAGQTFVSSSVYVGTSAISGSCVLTTSDDQLWSYDCPGGGTAVNSNTTAQGVSTTQTSAGSCTLAVAAAHFWTYSCSDGKAGMSKGAIPKSCKSTLETGYLAIFSCPSSSLGTSPTVKAASSKAQAGTAADTPRGCAGTLSDRRLSGLLCIL